MSMKLTVRVKPNSRVSEMHRQDDGTWLARIRSAPVDGKANEELVALIARRFGRRKAQVSIRRGVTGRAKLVEIAD